MEIKIETDIEIEMEVALIRYRDIPGLLLGLITSQTEKEIGR